ncbi:MAG: translocation/assembly module TamB domain-containing protein, partial [Flavipsychrobacter sp.]
GDHHNDTMLYAGEVQVRVTDWFFLRNTTPVLHYIGLHDAYVHLYRTPTSGEWNYQFLADAFSTKKTAKKKSGTIEIDLRKVDLQNVRFHMIDAWVGDDMTYDVGNFQLDAKGVDFKQKLIDVNTIEAERVAISLYDYKGGRPPNLSKHNTTPEIDTTPFNPDKWRVKLNKLSLKDCAFNLKSAEDIPVADEFDATHLYIKNIALNANDISITGDTIHGQVNHLTALERCGLMIKEMRAKVTVSPNASICDNLYLETNHSKVQHYYAMLYKRFPDFTDYITKVTMVARLKDALVDERDIAYFAPILRRYPTVVHVSGDGRGTVANLSGQHMQVTDGNTVVKGDFSMKGLPDIYKTLIEFKNGEILTTGAGILHYAPSLKNNPNLALEKVRYAYFKGNYTGYIENFAVNGVLSSNLGTVISNVKMNLPGFSSNKSVYSGTIGSDHFDLGTLLRQPELGTITLKADINGMSFDPEHAQIKTDATVSDLELHGYHYKNITAEGILARKQFNGKMLVDDTNLALAFYGTIDYSQKMLSINAKANLLKSNFYNLHLTKDTIEAVADFDLNCTASNIDNFLGTAKLYNIDVRRNLHRLNLDSVNVNSEIVGNEKQLTVQSNDITAYIKGDYTLSKLPYSVQYYLSGYLPNYIKAPSKTAPEQNLTFSITTRGIDKLLSVANKTVGGFNDATINGSLNTNEQKLTLSAKVPYGYIGGYQLTNISIDGQGSFNLLSLNTQIENITLADSLLSGSLSVTTTLGNDSLHFNIATAAPEAYTSATINGNAIAHGDSLTISILPSEFYLNQTKWNIPAGNKIVYAHNYLLIRNLDLLSGLQHINVTTELENSEQNLLVKTENLDLSQFGAWGGFAAYQPDGRVNGTVQITHLFKNYYATADLKASNVKLGNDTIGNIALSGSYDGAKRLLSLAPQTGIYREASSLTASGNMSFDKNTYQQLDGNIQFNAVPVSWVEPFFVGYISNVSGQLNGSIAIQGTSQQPDINGKVNLQNAGMRIDFLGSAFTIPAGTINVSNTKIDFGEITLYDSYKNQAQLKGSILHDHFKNMRLNLRITSDKFEVFNLHDYENQIFYGNLVASFNPLTIRGPFDDISMNIDHAVPVGRSHIYIPVSYGNGTGTYSYVSFKTYGKEQEKVIRKNRNKLSINISAEMNDLAMMTLVLDPTTGDAINATGTGSLRMEVPANNDIRMYGGYNIDAGDYTVTFKQLFFKRKFILNSGSSIAFNGPFNQTNLRIDATYTTRARLYDLLSDAEKQNGVISQSEMSDAKISQDVDVLLHMNGSLSNPKLTFNVRLPETRSIGTYAYTKLDRLNSDERQLFDQVASLLLVGNFVPPEGVVGSTAKSGAINNVSEIISSTASSQITNLVNKLLGNENLAIDLKYVNYNLSDPTLGGINRNEVSLGVKKDYFNDRLSVEVGGKSNWGTPASSSNTSNFNIAGDFRIQYLLREGGNLRFNLFRTSDYDVALNSNIVRSGLGLSWRKSFDNFSDFLHGAGYLRKKAQEKAADTLKNTNGNGEETSNN